MTRGDIQTIGTRPSAGAASGFIATTLVQRRARDRYSVFGLLSGATEGCLGPGGVVGT